MSGHTPGPWSMRLYTGHASDHNDWPGEIVADDGTEIYSGPFSFRALHGRTPKEAEANARLIAAAPDLLAVCEDMLPLLEHAEKCEAIADDSLGNRLRALRRRLKIARTAIAKAKGAT